jgi:hypothetical protein
LTYSDKHEYLFIYPGIQKLNDRNILVFSGKPFRGTHFGNVIEKLDITRLTDTHKLFTVFVTAYFVDDLLALSRYLANREKRRTLSKYVSKREENLLQVYAETTRNM